MMKITIEVPDDFYDLPHEEKSQLLAKAVERENASPPPLQTTRLQIRELWEMILKPGHPQTVHEGLRRGVAAPENAHQSFSKSCFHQKYQLRICFL